MSVCVRVCERESVRVCVHMCESVSVCKCESVCTHVCESVRVCVCVRVFGELTNKHRYPPRSPPSGSARWLRDEVR